MIAHLSPTGLHLFLTVSSLWWVLWLHDFTLVSQLSPTVSSPLWVLWLHDFTLVWTWTWTKKSVCGQRWCDSCGPSPSVMSLGRSVLCGVREKCACVSPKVLVQTWRARGWVFQVAWLHLAQRVANVAVSCGFA